MRSRGSSFTFITAVTIGSANAEWRLIDPNGNELFDSTSMTSDQDLIMAYDGQYSLVISGNSNDTSMPRFH